MPKPTKKMGNASAEWSLQASNLNVNDAVLAKFEHDMDVVLQHHVFSDVKTMKPVEIVEGAAKHEAGHQAGLLVEKKWENGPGLTRYVACLPGSTHQSGMSPTGEGLGDPCFL